MWLFIKEFLLDFVDMVYPRVCLNCDTILLYQEEHICMPCKFSLPKTNYHLRKDNPLEQKFVYEPRVKAVAAFLYYNKGGVAQKIISELKYRGVQEVGKKIGNWYGNDLKEMNWVIDFIIPVPLHPSKQKKRGFNQSESFAEGLSEIIEIPIETEVVKRTRNTSTQTRKSKVDRWRNMDEVYALTDPAKIQGKKVMIVDDVLTTGATIGEMVALLSNEGVSHIYIVTMAAGK